MLTYFEYEAHRGEECIIAFKVVKGISRCMWCPFNTNDYCGCKAQYKLFNTYDAQQVGCPLIQFSSNRRKR